MATPMERSCSTRRQTAKRLVPISSPMRVSLTTTVAFSVSRRTMRPRRWSVRAEVCGAARRLARLRDGRWRAMAEDYAGGMGKEQR